MPAERHSKLAPLERHEWLLERHRTRLIELMMIALGTGAVLVEMSFIIADLKGEFGLACIAQGAGLEFAVVSSDAEAVVIPLDVFGLLAILRSVVPDGVEPVVSRATGTIPILVVDAEDEPAIMILGIHELCT